MAQDTTCRELCIHCNKAIERTPSLVPCLEWIHADGFYHCDGRQGHSDTFATAVVDKLEEGIRCTNYIGLNESNPTYNVSFYLSKSEWEELKAWIASRK